MKVVVEVMPRPEALDPQGRAVHGTLDKMGFDLSDCRVGKMVTLDLNVKDTDEGIKVAKEMAEKLLCNPLIETYEVRAL